MSNTDIGVSPSGDYQPTPFGKDMLKHFSFEPGYRNLNHGSFGTFPTAIGDKATELRIYCERRPCSFIKYEFFGLLDESRAAVAKLLNAPLSTIVYVQNATTGVNTVLRNLVWNPDGKDEILQFNIIYGSCGKTTNYVCEATNNIVRTRQIALTYPIEDADVLSAFKDAVQLSRASGYRPRIAIFDTVVSNPGLRFPFEALTSICRDKGILSLIDAAHGIGHVKLDLAALDPDFLVTNCHKWLFVPRACAAFYVPERNQELMRSTLPTGHGFVPLSEKNSLGSERSLSKQENTQQKSEFVLNFEFLGTLDNTPYLCVPEAIKWREEVCGGEEKIRSYCSDLAREGGRKVAEMLGTSILDNNTHTLTDCCLVNILLPFNIGGNTSDDKNFIKTRGGTEHAILDWMQRTLIADYKTFFPIFFFQGALWARLSGQVYLDMDDFEWAGLTLKELCNRVGREEFLDATS